jgi:hypothetical protein
MTEGENGDGLFDRLDRANNNVEVRPVAGIEFGMDKLAIGPNFKGAAARRNQDERFDALAEFEDLGRQTDGLRRVVSNHAVFDRNFCLHLGSFPPTSVSVEPDVVKEAGRWRASRRFATALELFEFVDLVQRGTGALIYARYDQRV